MSLGDVSQVQNVKATVISSTDIHVTWDKPDAGGATFTIQRYFIKVYRQYSMSVEILVEVDGSQTTATITGLSGSTTYRIEVSATNGQYTGAPSEGTLATTEKSSSGRHHYSKQLCLFVSYSSSRLNLRFINASKYLKYKHINLLTMTLIITSNNNNKYNNLFLSHQIWCSSLIGAT